MKRSYHLFILSFLLLFSFVSLHAASISGTVTDATNGQHLSHANITVTGTQIGAMTNKKGTFSLQGLVAGPITLRIRYVGYETADTTISASENAPIVLMLKLYPAVIPTSGVVVTSNRYEQELKDVALPVRVVTSRQIENTAPISLPDAIATEPGISLSRDGIWGTRAVIRGLSQQKIVTLVDGNRIDTAPDLAAGMSMVDVNDIERVEVIRGAGSALYGTGAVGGVINVVTKKGTYTDAFHFNGSVISSYGSVNNLGAGHLKLNTGGSNWYLYASTMYRSAENTQTPTGELENSQFSDNNIAVKAGFKPYKNQEIRLNFQQFNAEDVGIPGSFAFPVSAKVTYPSEQREMLSAEWIGRNWSSHLRQTSLKFFYQDIERRVESIPNIVKLIPGPPDKRMTVNSIYPGADHFTDGAQFQTDWLLNQQNFFIAGIDYWQKKYEGFRTKNLTIEILSPADNSVINTIEKAVADLPLPDSKYQSLGFYAQNEFKTSNEKLALTVGGRYDFIHTENDEGLYPLYEITNGVRNDTPAGQAPLWLAAEDDDKSWSANASAWYQLTPAMRLVATGARSFRSPSLEERYQYIDLGSIVKIGDPNLEPEDGWFSDLGFQLNTNKLAWNANIFYNQLENLVIESPSTYEGRQALQKANVGKARLYGFDSRLDWLFQPGMSVYSTIAYVRGEDRTDDSPLPSIPALSGQIGYSWKTRLFDLNVSAIMFANQDNPAAGEVSTPGYTYFNSYIATRPLKLAAFQNRFVLGIENITDREYRNHLSTNRGLVDSEPGRNVILRWILDF
ncbi:TonB-dependent receptor [bacterium]|nr:TonB-dependent receptor [bacterium]